MERLTEKFDDGEVFCGKIGAVEDVGIDETIFVGELVDKLAEYEQAEEDGLLIRLPCKVGEIIYEIQEDRLSSTIETIEFEGREYHRHIPKYFISMNMFSLSKMEKMGKTVFLTKSEAEQALAKMKGV